MDVSKITDNAGNSIPCVDVHIDGKILQCPTPFKYCDEVISQRSSFKSRPNDVWICAYPKSGYLYHFDIRYACVSANQSIYYQCYK